jgi:hypothetical protein
MMVEKTGDLLRMHSGIRAESASGYDSRQRMNPHMLA